MQWQILKKTSVHLHLEFDKGDFSPNLTAKDIQINLTEQLTQISVDLNHNLHTTNPHIRTDAEELRDGKISRLSRVHITDDTVIKKWVERKFNSSMKWQLIVELNGPHPFVVTPEVTAHSLILAVAPAR